MQCSNGPRPRCSSRRGVPFFVCSAESRLYHSSSQSRPSMSSSPSFTPTVQSSDSTDGELRTIAVGLDRMENKALSSQRVVLDEEKTDNMRKLALGAKLERALDRRMSGQDAVMRPRGKSVSVEKDAEKSA